MLSAVIITKNEEENIGRCLTSLAFADEIIVVDDGSTDKTCKIAADLGARVIQHPWAGFGVQKNIGLDAATHDWVLCIDADEEVSPDLAAEITSTVMAAKYDVYWLPVLDFFLGKPMPHLQGNNPRLLRTSKARWTNRAVHEQVTLTNTQGYIVRLGDTYSGVLTQPLFHHGHKTIRSYLTKMHRYTSLDAEQMATTNRHRSGRAVTPHIFLPLQLMIRQFIKLAFWRGGYKDGYPGLMWAILSAYYEWEMAQKYRALHKK